MMVDTLGMSTLFYPDLQYHFHGMNPDEIVNHAYSVLYYIFEHDIILLMTGKRLQG